MIAMVEGAKRQKTPNEIALAILLAALTLVFLLVVATLLPYSIFSVQVSGHGQPISLTVLVALFVCLAPTTIGALLSAIGIAGMNRLSRANVIAMSGRAVEAAGDVDVLLLDKTGTITLGNRQATRFIPADGVSEQEFAEAAQSGLPGRRDGRRAEYRRAGQEEMWPARARSGADQTTLRSVLGAYQNERSEHRRRGNPEGSGRGH